MATKLVIVESPAKAKTIGGILGSDFDVQASVGHIRDLPPNGRSLPDEHKKKWWADYAVDVDNDFQPIYEVPKEKQKQVSALKQALKGKETLVLATDEDREGESISWHLLEVLKPPKGVKVQRIAFHEITKEAISRALQEPRDIDLKLVEAQEARRILDRLYGYTLSPVLWSRVTKNLSAGRVQSPAVKLIVEREEQRRRFRTGAYWGLKAELATEGQSFPAELRAIEGTRVATGSDFDDSTGDLRKGSREVVLLDEARARSLAEASLKAVPWTVSAVNAKEGIEKPAPPFMTTTLQQDANRKFGYSADRTMRIAQSLYEGVTVGGETVGLITYMRTDSLALSGEALDGIRGLIRREYKDCLPSEPQRYASKVRNAQEAHEAIRPTDADRKPAEIQRYLNDEQFRLYDLIWKRTVACQMSPARVLKTEVEIEVRAGNEKLRFETSGKQILFDGYRRVYLEGLDDPDAERESMERRLPRLEEGMSLDAKGVDAQAHHTKPPARYTDATLIRKLEEQGIGRPSTYASIIATIVDRGYVRKGGKQLIPTWTAYQTMEVLEANFAEFMELGFTARMDDALDDVAEGGRDAKDYLKEFFLGDGDRIGLRSAVEARKKTIPYPAFMIGLHPETGEEIFVRTDKATRAFLQLGPKENKKFADVPDDMAPAEMTVERALELFDKKPAEAESVGFDPNTGRRLILKQRNGYYLEVERTPEEVEEKLKPTWVSLPPHVDPRTLEQDDLDFLCSLPREIGSHPTTGEAILFKIGKFGAYLESGAERRTVEDWRKGQTMAVEEAVEILAAPKFRTQRTRQVIKDLGRSDDWQDGPIRVMTGQWGPYVTDTVLNVTLSRDKDPNSITLEEAIALLRKKRDDGGAGLGAKKRRPTPRKTPGSARRRLK